MNKAKRCSLDSALNCRASSLMSVSIGTLRLNVSGEECRYQPDGLNGKGCRAGTNPVLMAGNSKKQFDSCQIVFGFLMGNLGLHTRGVLLSV